ncbi:hypothetical protein OEZ86_014233 [Tetradesmus obliquus]|nr:hypothetical protein OEZ86_014233 [Tetradesmus obliquus]
MAPTFLETSTSKQQHELELKVCDAYQDLLEFEGQDRDELLLLLKDRHARYLQAGLGQLPSGFISLDASRPWICYWVLHGLALLQAPLPSSISSSQVITFLQACQHASGGYGGGPGHLPHLAPTYAAVCALLTLGGAEAYDSIDRAGVWDFLCRMAVPPEQGGGFRMHEGGECDARSCFTALAVASALCLDVPGLVARSGVVDFLRRCQTYEGGLGGEPGNEAHGGYTFCGLAALVLAGCPHALDLQRLLHWAAQRQGWSEGGFNGRTNKLVDGCYSFWQGGVFPLLQELLGVQQPQEELAQQAQHQLGLCRNVATYAPLEPPASWQQQQQQQEELVVPDLPDLSRVLGPLQQAELEAERLNAACDALAEAAIQRHKDDTAAAAATAADTGKPEQAAAETAGQGSAAGEPEVVERDSTQQLLERAQAAEQAAEYADQNVEIATASAAVLYPCSGAPSPPDLYTLLASPAAAAAAAAAGVPDRSSAEGDGSAAGNPLFNPRALQCWLLRACQQLKGGLRDKPGKSADYYHSCYCLSGLSMAQHIAGGGVVGPAQNQLPRVDPLVNVLAGKLQQAKEHFGALPQPGRLG